jgi:hypothetical protein
MRCNKGKTGGLLPASQEMSHPYFEGQEIENDVWLRAELVEKSLIIANYSVCIPSHWPAALGHRVTSYFSKFDLASRYAVEAASELVSVSAYLRALPSSDVCLDHLQRVAGQERQLSKNSWRAALYAALAASDWYSARGFR